MRKMEDEEIQQINKRLESDGIDATATAELKLRYVWRKLCQAEEQLQHAMQDIDDINDRHFNEKSQLEDYLQHCQTLMNEFQEYTVEMAKAKQSSANNSHNSKFSAYSVIKSNISMSTPLAKGRNGVSSPSSTFSSPYISPREEKYRDITNTNKSSMDSVLANIKLEQVQCYNDELKEKVKQLNKTLKVERDRAMTRDVEHQIAINKIKITSEQMATNKKFNLDIFKFTDSNKLADQMSENNESESYKEKLSNLAMENEVLKHQVNAIATQFSDRSELYEQMQSEIDFTQKQNHFIRQRYDQLVFQLEQEMSDAADIEIRNCQEKLSHYQDMSERYADECDCLRMQVQKLQQELEATLIASAGIEKVYSQSIDDFRKEKIRLEKLLELKDNKDKKQIDTVARYSGKHIALECQVNHLKSQLKKFQDQNTELEKQLKATKITFEERFKNTNDDNIRLANQLSEKIQDIRKQDETLAQIKDCSARAEKDKEKLRIELDNHKLQVARFEQELQISIKNTRLMEEKFLEEQRIKNGLTGWIEKCKIKLQHYRVAKKRLIKEKSVRHALQEKVKKSGRQVKLLQENQKNFKDIIDQLQKSVNITQNELRLNQAQKENLQNLLNQKQGSISVLQQQIKQMEQECYVLTTNFEDASNQLSARGYSHKNAITELIGKMEEQRESYEIERGKLDNIIHSLEHQLEIYNEKLGEFNSIHARQQQAICHLLEEKKQLEDRLTLKSQLQEDNRMLLDKITAQFEIIEKENQLLQDKARSLQLDKERLGKELDNKNINDSSWDAENLYSNPWYHVKYHDEDIDSDHYKQLHKNYNIEEFLNSPGKGSSLHEFDY
ncbi:hypothetical protein TrispH2_009439 [Trichoplax sp. H2]|nr:hypothetical protein TrispH2_009439 [Trichoplax sp. H2]|eukprot:RDD38844.1 hypothetical protein TrispH2_009439 [Trichoplax sp. H2]